MTYNLGWGNSLAVRKAFLDTAKGLPYHFTYHTLADFDYPVHEGDPELIAITRNVIKRQTGKDYKHVYLTNGATGGDVITMRAYSQYGFSNCITRMPPYYVRYPKMIEASGLRHVFNKFNTCNGAVMLLDFPSNPLGLVDSLGYTGINPVILDGAYLSATYLPFYIKVPQHDVFVGSYSKTLGINGIRVGWVATDNDFLALKLKELITSEYCGLSTASTVLLKEVLKDFDWETFELKASNSLNLNRENWSKLEKYFEDDVPSVGMFHYTKMDNLSKKLMEKAGILWTLGSSLGTNDDFGRFNLGQDCETINKAVKQVLKIDRIKK